MIRHPSPAFRLAKQSSDLAKSQLTEDTQTEHFFIRIRERMQDAMDLHHRFPICQIWRRSCRHRQILLQQRHLADDAQSNPHVQKVREYAKETDSEVFALCAEIEQEISELEDDEKKEFLEDLGIKQSGLEKLIVASYRLLGLLSFLTAGEDETRAWTIKVGTKAPQAAGKIHSDFERGFIKAEVVNYRDLLESGSYAGAREKGLVRMEGKDYVVQDGDVILFRFNV